MSAAALTARLPGIGVLARRCRALALLDAIVWPGGHRWFHFIADHRGGPQVGVLLDGHGGDCQVVFTEAGVAIIGFDPGGEQASSPRECAAALVGAGVPHLVTEMLAPPLLADGDLAIPATYVLWRQSTTSCWRGVHLDVEGCGGLSSDTQLLGASRAADRHGILEILTDAGALAYHRRAGHRGIHLQLDAVAHLFAGQPLTQDLLAALHPGLTLADLHTDLAAAGPHPYQHHRHYGHDGHSAGDAGVSASGGMPMDWLSGVGSRS